MPTLNRRHFLSAGAALAGSAMLPRRAAAQGRRPPNVVFILADDWGWGDLSCYGNPTLRTPNLDRLAAFGTRFTNFYVAGSVCSPSRCGFLTGRCPARYGVHGHFATADQNAARAMPNWLDPATPTIVRLLKEAGYATGHFGKWHLGSGADAPFVKDYGFDECRTNVSRDNNLVDGPSPRSASSQVICDHTMRFIEAHRSRPFYVNCWLNDVHATLDPSSEQLEAVKNWGVTDIGNKTKYTTPQQVYYAAAMDADKQIGRILDKLRELDLINDTILVFSSDNGPEDMAIGNARHSGVGSPGPFRGRKRSLYDGGIRVPLIVRWIGHTPPGSVDHETVIGGVDWLPTIAAACGVNVPADLALDGQSLLPALNGAPTARQTPLRWEWRYRIVGHPSNISPNLAIRDGQWKLLLNPDRSRVELYDLKANQAEWDNLAEHHPERVEALAAQALAWQQTLPAGPLDPGAGSNAWPWPQPIARPAG
ncbi:MAG: sulfatase-like hydrolase/transferase [Fimbriimonadaceae bacterium]|nr:sulfatase-like hydrolase/transferase [Fimbriimonadaceae bacterium]